MALPLRRVADVFRGFVAQHFSRQVLRRIEQGCCRRRHDGADIGAGPDHLLQRRRERGSVHGRRNERPRPCVSKRFDLFDHFAGIIAGLRDPICKPAILGRKFKAACDALA